jgi:predicted transposase/invertase (TIGR01784 family)
MCRINPRVDFAFKKLFGSEENKDLLLSLVNAILDPRPPIAEVVLKNPYNLADYKAGKMSILDIKARDEQGRWVNVEIQVNEDSHYDKRALYYWSKLVTEQLSEGRMYQELRKTFSINILDFDLTPGNQFQNRYRILNADTCQDDGLHDVFELHYLELRRFNKGFDQLTTALDRWAAFLSRAHQLDKRALPPALATDPSIVKAVAEVDRMFDEEEREIYDVRMRVVMDEMSRIASAEEKGLSMGQAIGEARGKEQANRDHARRMLAEGLAVELIERVTGLSAAEIKVLGPV